MSMTAFTFIVLLVLLLCIVYARATWEGESPSCHAPTVTAAFQREYNLFGNTPGASE